MLYEFIKSVNATHAIKDVKKLYLFVSFVSSFVSFTDSFTY